ncbi:MAG: 50S ribosomal protein L23 [Candidatus Harrisonbacteria bacterium CG10_big_fil_rev_8_21_14_0_10_38_8]|uniref:Large ribosomal subunit protein uL23 n=1 Tax=Candidatus Harrisonbacteria bacterium CG10_big_fil_rev_8_21_14_0_10_38_8 TaxID=1974582 RepID=A0A2M6WK76_9BACT|nr:MAG: 50S ribosomal protein L23 [Candidatus Harrisonbacteria bacterium CG10_big_fil_rev_8_21_14_0_10_38_8]
MSSKLLIKNPIITEKATSLTAFNKYAFEVVGTANKSEVKKAIEKAYGVKVIKVHVVNVKSKKRRLGRTVGVKSGYKKAIVTLKEGEKLDIVGA